MGNLLGTMKFYGTSNKAFTPNREEDFVEQNLGYPCRVVTGNKAVQSIFDPDLIKRNEYHFTGVIVREEFTEGVCPSALANGKFHEKHKAFMLAVVSKAYPEVPASTALSVLSNVSQWGRKPLDDFESKLMAVVADAILPTIFGESTPFDVKEIQYYIGGSMTPRSWILKALSSWKNLDEERRAMASIIGKIKTSERYHQLMDLGKSHGLGEKEATMTLLFAPFFGATGITSSNLTTSFACLDTISAEDREELREEALAALRKHGGLTREALEEMPKIESFVLEVLRAHPSPEMFNGNAARRTTVPYTTASGEHKEVELKEGEVVVGSFYWAMKDPAVFDKPDDFVWRRFLGPEGQARREHHVIFHGRVVDTPAANNHMCAGKDVALSVLKGSIAILNTFFGWELQEPPFWTGTKLLRVGQPDNGVKIKSFWVQHSEDLKEIFPSHYNDIVAKMDEVAPKVAG